MGKTFSYKEVSVKQAERKAELVTGLAMPPTRRVGSARKGESKYPFKRMEVGQALVETVLYEEKPARVQGRLASAARKAAEGLGWKFETRIFEDEKGVVKVGIWRVS